jgi:hypothetical protein
MTGSAASLISDAEAFGIILEVRGDNLRCGSSAPMPPALRDLFREHKPDIIKELERRASRAESWLAQAHDAEAEKVSRAEKAQKAQAEKAPDIKAPAPARPMAPSDSPACGTSPPGSSSSSPNPPPAPPLAVSRALESALVLAERSHVSFWLDERGLLITQPPRDYRREVQVAERALMERREEIKTICCWPRRPKGYSDAHWVRAAVDSCRLGYNLWREG